ncbi:MAG: rhodanese-like domain-containing protein, partial [Betaproteobacteria bacterium]|nr:rhodanese-like domain-containing protein [Betaproteobacteria bacterium]
MVEFALANIGWVALAVAASAGLAWTVVRDGAQSIEHSEAVLWVKSGKGIFVDIRAASDFSRGRIAQSRNIPAEELQNRAAEIDRYREKPVVLVCQNGMQSRRRAQELAAAGFREVRAMRGGMSAWLDA